MVEGLESGAVVAHVLGGPEAAELVAAGAEFSDEVVQLLVVGIAPGLGPEDRGGDLGEVSPVRMELVGTVVQEDEAGEVKRLEISDRYDEFILAWMADIYTYLQWKYALPSEQIAEKIFPEDLYKKYYPLHETSIENAVDKLKQIYSL